MRLVPQQAHTARILRLGLPIMAGSSSYVIIGLADLLFVGQFGTAALAAIGTGSFVGWVFASAFSGFQIAVQATASRRKGAGQLDSLAIPLNAALILIALGAPIPALLLFAHTGSIFALMSNDAEVITHGVAYLQWIWWSSLLFGMTSAFNGFWNGTDRPTYYMRVVLVSTLANVPLNYVFMFGLGPISAFGVEGAGIGTFTASAFGVLYHVVLGARFALPEGFARALPARDECTLLLRLAIPGSTQMVLESFALTAMFRIVGMVGTVELAAYTVLVNLISFVGLPAWGLGTAGATLVGQALGAHSVADPRRWAWDVIRVGCPLITVLGVPFWAAPELLLRTFIHEPETLAMAVTPCRILGVVIILNSVGYMLSSMLNGAGDVKRVMYVNVLTQYVVLLPGAWLAGPVLGYGFLGIWLVHQLGFRFAQSLIYASMWHRGKWARLTLWLACQLRRNMRPASARRVRRSPAYKPALIALHRHNVTGLLVPEQHTLDHFCTDGRVLGMVNQVDRLGRIIV